MAFQPGEQVSIRGRADARGRIVSGPNRIAGQDWYRVDFGPRGISNVPEVQLQETIPGQDVLELLKASVFGSKEGLSRLLTLTKLTSSLGDNIYALHSSRTLFYPHQFKPILKFLNSYNHRLLIADEVGLGKTIEAGLILTELRARYERLHRVLVVCPSHLCEKWRLEMRGRFNLEFRVIQRDVIVQFLKDCGQESPPALQAICSLETMRRSDLREMWESAVPPMDLVIVDESHHLRTPGTLSNAIGRTLSDTADALLLLTATPVQTKTEDLFRLLQVLDPEQFDDDAVFGERVQANEPIIKAASALRKIPPDIHACRESIESALKGYAATWYKANPSLPLLKEKLRTTDTTSRAQVVDLQRDLEDLNLLSRVVNRTKKRDVHEYSAVRDAHVVPVNFTPREAEFYAAVTRYVRKRVAANGRGIMAFAVMMPQRQMASSINAMVEYYRQNPVQPLPSSGTDQGLLDLEIADDENQVMEVPALKPEEELMEIVRNWPHDQKDTKAEKLMEIILGLDKQDAGAKIICFAYFKKTLTYLNTLLNAQGIPTCLITGDVPENRRGRIEEETRSSIIEKFRQDPRIKVLLSSEVGSEGLDFQFANTIVNYDLPWNPMKLEQRIGRIDRIGQKNELVRIYSLSVPGTIEYEILNRLYRRIGIFERSIGDLETILGDEIREMTLDLMSPNLTPEQQADRIERTALAIERKKQEMAFLEENSAQFIGQDEFFREEIDRVNSEGRYVTEKEIEVLVRDTLRSRFPRTRITAEAQTGIVRLRPDQELIQSLRQQARENEELYQFIGKAHSGDGILCTFLQARAVESPQIEFINAVHPFVNAVVQMQRGDRQDMHPVAEIHLCTNLVPQGRYFFFVFLLQVKAARSSNTLESVVVSAADAIPLPEDKSARLTAQLVTAGKSPPMGNTPITPDEAERMYRIAQGVLGDKISKRREMLSRVNDGLASSRAESLRRSYEPKIKKREDLLSRGKREGRDSRYLRMLEGGIRNLKIQLADRKANIEAGRVLSMEFSEVVAGVLVVKPAEKENS